MENYNIVSILSAIFEYTEDQSIIECDENNFLTSIVTMKTLENHIKIQVAEIYNLVIGKYSSFMNFLTDEKTRNISKRWCLEVTTLNKYRENSLLSKFKPTNFKKYDEPSGEELLFVIYRFKNRNGNRTKTSVEYLCQEIFDCSKKFFLSKSDYNERENLKDLLNYAVQFNFPEIDATVNLIGGSKYQMDFNDSTLKLAIYISNLKIFEEYYDDEFIPDFLKCIGIQGYNFLEFNNTYLFVAPIKMSCQIGVINDIYTYAIDQLISEYLILDKRVKPLVCAVLYFLKCKNENELRYLKTLDIHTSIIMVLEFLAEGLLEPLIPNLCSYTSDCKSNNCVYNNYFYNTSSTEIRYHDCIRVENSIVGNKYSNIEYDLIKSTTWRSYNGDNLATLLENFFEHYSQTNNFLRCILVEEGYGNIIPRPKEYIQYFNIDNEDRVLGYEVCKIFSNAFKSLKAGKSFDYICNKYMKV